MNGAERSRPEREAIIIGYGFEYLVMAVNCARSIRVSNPGLPTTLVTNVSIDPASVADVFDRVVRRDEPADRNRFVKTSILDYTVAENVIYVDADSEVVGDLDPAFRLLTRFDVGLKSHAVPVNKAFELAPGIPGGTFTHFNGGMLLLRDCPSARMFLAQWQRRMIESCLNRDQPALARTVFDLPDLRLIVLGLVWSADETEFNRLVVATKHEPPRIRHYARPHLDAGVARRLRDTAERLLPMLSAVVLADPDVARVLEKYRRITHPLFRCRLSRRVYVAAAHRIGLLRGRGVVNLLDRRSSAIGRRYEGDGRRYWADDGESG